MRRRRSNPLLRLIKLLVVLLVLGAIVFLLAEWGAGQAVKSLREQRATPERHSDAQLSQLFDSDDPAGRRDILVETTKAQELIYTPFTEFRMAPYQGTWVNIGEDGVRSNGSAEAAAAAAPVVAVFGGGSVFGVGVADGETIPAYLEQALRGAGKTVRVLNLGAIHYYSTQERIALEQMLTSGKKPQVAVFVDGLADFYMCASPDQSAWNERLIQLTRARSRMPLGVELSHRLGLAQLMRHLGGDKSVVVREWGSFCDSEEMVSKVAQRLDTNRRIIAATAEKMGFKALFVQQPVPTFNYDNRKRPMPVDEAAMGYHMNSARGYPRMQQMREEGKLLGENLLWLTDLEPAEGNAYIDAVHYSPRFNKLIADRIAQHVLDGGWLP